ncbi:hypothetical protein [Spiroplasma endosymbiont of Lonchoptera lutea]
MNLENTSLHKKCPKKGCQSINSTPRKSLSYKRPIDLIQLF